MAKRYVIHDFLTEDVISELQCSNCKMSSLCKRSFEPIYSRATGLFGGFVTGCVDFQSNKSVKKNYVCPSMVVLFDNAAICSL